MLRLTLRQARAKPGVRERPPAFSLLSLLRQPWRQDSWHTNPKPEVVRNYYFFGIGGPILFWVGATRPPLSTSATRPYYDSRSV